MDEASTEADAVTEAMDRLARADRGRLLSSLVGALGDFQLAEDSLQDALESALVHWRRSGLPRSPAPEEIFTREFLPPLEERARPVG